MKLITFILAVGLITVSLFGFVAMGAGGIGCVFSATGMNASDCPQAMLSMAMHHISAYTDFSQVTVSSVTAILLSILLSMIAIAYVVSVRSRLFDEKLLIPVRPYVQDKENSIIRECRKISDWLSLLLNSPANI